MSAVARMIEVAEQSKSYDGDELVVLDGLTRNPRSGVRVTLRYDGQHGHFVADTRDGSGRCVSVIGHYRVAAVARSLNGYLDIVNNGI